MPSTGFTARAWFWIRISFSSGVHMGADLTSKGWAFEAVIQAALLDAMLKALNVELHFQ